MGYFMLLLQLRTVLHTAAEVCFLFLLFCSPLICHVIAYLTSLHLFSMLYCSSE